MSVETGVKTLETLDPTVIGFMDNVAQITGKFDSASDRFQELQVDLLDSSDLAVPVSIAAVEGAKAVLHQKWSTHEAIQKKEYCAVDPDETRGAFLATFEWTKRFLEPLDAFLKTEGQPVMRYETEMFGGFIVCGLTEGQGLDVRYPFVWDTESHPHSDAEAVINIDALESNEIFPALEENTERQSSGKRKSRLEGQLRKIKEPVRVYYLGNHSHSEDVDPINTQRVFRNCPLGQYQILTAMTSPMGYGSRMPGRKGIDFVDRKFGDKLGLKGHIQKLADEEYAREREAFKTEIQLRLARILLDDSSTSTIELLQDERIVSFNLSPLEILEGARVQIKNGFDRLEELAKSHKQDSDLDA